MRIVFLVGLIILSSCSNKKSLYFGTYTRVGIDASSDGVGIGVKHGALNVTPSKANGDAFDVIGTSDIDTAYTNVVINEMVAVGKAAKCAAQINSLKKKSRTTLSAEPKHNGSIIFGAYSSWSLLDLSWGGATGTGINFGYKRGVGVKMPIKDDSVGSVFAHITLNTTDVETISPKTNIGGTRSTHTFATGTAAIIKASAMAKELNGDNELFDGCISD